MTQKVFLSFSKQLKKPRVIETSLFKEDTENSTSVLKQEVGEIVGNKFKHIGGDSKKGAPLSIPLIGSHDKLKSARLKLKGYLKSQSNSIADTQSQPSDKGDTATSLDEEAVREILKDVRNAASKAYGHTSSSKIEFLDVDDLTSFKLGKVSTIADYEEISIDQYGAAMLRGMGWKKQEGIGRHRKVTEIAEPSTASLGTKTVKGEVTGQVDEEVEELKKGSYVFVKSGHNKGAYGIISSLDIDHLLIDTAVKHDVIREVEANVDLITKREYEDHSRVVNKDMYDTYKTKEVTNGHPGGENKECDSSVSKSGESGSSVKPIDNEKTKLDLTSIKYNRSDGTSSSSTGTRGKESEQVAETRKAETWVRKHLRVRLINKTYKGGRYHREKVIVVSVSSSGCDVETPSGRILHDLKCEWMETVIPKDSSRKVLVLAGSRKGKLGFISKFHKSSDEVSVEFIDDKNVKRYRYNEICEYLEK